MRRRTAFAVLFAVCVLSPHLAGAAATYPQRPIRLIAPFPPGGSPGKIVAYMRTELEKWSKVFSTAGIRSD